MIFAVSWFASILVSIFLKKYNNILLLKDLADLNLKLDLEKYSDYVDKTSSVSNIIIAIPFLNLVDQFYNIRQYRMAFNEIVENLSLLGVLEEMTDYEIEYYSKFPSVGRAFKLYSVPSIALIKKEKKELKNKEFVVTYSFFDNDYNSISFITKHSKFKIVKSSGPISNKNTKEQKEILFDLQDYICEYFMKKYGNDKAALEKLKEITYDDINEALGGSEFKIERELVLKKDLRKKK